MLLPLVKFEKSKYLLANITGRANDQHNFHIKNDIKMNKITKQF